MIKILIGRNDERFTLRCHGHACYAPAGQDIVCASVTVLCYTLIENLPPDKWSGRMDEGDIYISCECGPQSKERRAFEVIVKGLKMVASGYPANVMLLENVLSTKQQVEKIARAWK